MSTDCLNFSFSLAALCALGTQSKKLFLLSLPLCAGTCWALSIDVMKSYHIVNQSEGSVMVHIGTPKSITSGVVVAYYSESFILGADQNNLKSGQIRTLQDPILSQDFFYIEASPALISFSPLYSPRYQTFNSAQYHDSIYCIIDHQVNVNCTFDLLSN